MQGVDYQFLRSRTHPVGQNLKHYRENLPAIHARAPAIELSKAAARITCGRSAHLLSESVGDEEVVVVAVKMIEHNQDALENRNGVWPLLRGRPGFWS